MRSEFVCGAILLLCTPSGADAQPTESAPLIDGAGYSVGAPIKIAPGQLITLSVTGIKPLFVRAAAGSDLPTTLSEISIITEQLTGAYSVTRVPILEARRTPTCGHYILPPCTPPRAAVTIQVPYEIQYCWDMCLGCCRASYPSFHIRYNGEEMYVMEGDPYPDQVHIVRQFDSILPITEKAVVGPCTKATRNDNLVPSNWTGLPCPPVVKRKDGSTISWKNPAKAGEELVAYAVGLGATSPASETGKVARKSAATVQQFAMDFNYRPNALGTRPLPLKTPDVPKPIYTGTLEGEVGIYEVRFVVPPVPKGTMPCASFENIDGLPRENVIYSNLTFSIGGRFSFDGAGICVDTGEEESQ